MSPPPESAPRSFLPVAPPAKRVSMRRPVAAAAALVGTLLAVWAGTATWYIASHDELAQRYLAYETERRFVYEDRIAALATQLEREVTLHSVERRRFEERVAAVSDRQAAIEARQTRLREAAERAAGGALPSQSVSSARPAGEASRGARPEPMRDLSLRTTEADATAPAPEPKPSPRDRLGLVEEALGRATADLARDSETLRHAAALRLAGLRRALDATGLAPRVARLVSPAAAMGGPLLPVPTGAGPADLAGAETDRLVAETASLAALVRALPLGRPAGAEAELTSGYGVRLDPFTRTMALHAGIDFRDEPGAPVRATGSGRVVAAEFTGGYGNMVEIDHGHGLVTRYGHLSAFAVAPGTTVAAGQIVGRVGSTGQSTGPHVHYETRVDGEPVDPTRFLDAGRLLAKAGG